jgi:hypothetical protein
MKQLTFADIIPLSALLGTQMMRYTVQCQAPAGNWYDVLGTNDVHLVVRHANYHVEKGDEVRIVDNYL